MTCLTYVLTACVIVLCTTPSVAKNDIRGVETGKPLADALDTLVLDGARCPGVEDGPPEICTYDERTTMTLYYARGGAQLVQKIVYSFPFAARTKVKDRLRDLYGLRRDRIEGEHRLDTGERLLVELDDKGTGTVSIINDRAIDQGVGR